MRYPITTGRGAQVLGVIEPQLSETVRRGKVDPPPPVIAGRRLWCSEHLIQAAEALGILTDDLRARINREAPAGARALEAFSRRGVRDGAGS